MIVVHFKQIARHKHIIQCVSCALNCHSWPTICRPRIMTYFQTHQYNTQPLTEPSPSGEPKNYPVKIQNIVNEISKLTLLEVAELNQLLKKSLNIPDAAPMMPMGFMPMAAAPATEGEEQEPQKVKSSFTVKLSKFDESKKVALIREIKGLMEGMNLVQAKKFVESAPQVVKADIGKDEADKLKAALEAVGATVEVE